MGDLANADRTRFKWFDIRSFPAEARRALGQFAGSAHDALAQTDDEEYEIQTRKLSL